MKKLLMLGLISWLCGSVNAQTNPAPVSTNPPAAAPATAPPSTPAAEAKTTPATTGVVGGRNAVYTDLIPADQLVTLDAAGAKFQGWYIADLSGQPRGAAIVLHDSGHLPSWPFTAAALINDLPLHGWDTLNIELPTPAATDGVEPQTQARISAAIKYFSDKNQSNIALIGFGSGAIRAAEAVQLMAAANPTTPDNTAPITALVMIAPEQHINGIAMDLAKLLPLTGIPALDMTLDSEVQTRADADARRRAVLHQRARIYTRLELPPINDASNAQQSTMVKRVRTWLQVNAHENKSPARNASRPL